jgi:hypothetical protein
MKKNILFFALLSISFFGISQEVSFDVVHVLDSGDAQVTATIQGLTSASVATVNKHGDTIPINFTSSFSQATNEKTIVVSNLNEGVYEVHFSDNGLDFYSYCWVGKYGDSTTLFIQPDSNYGIDASLIYCTKPDRIYQASTNYGNHTALYSYYGTNGGYPYLIRGAIKFHYFGLESANIESAELSLAVLSYRNQGYWGNQSIENEAVIRQFIDPWDEKTISWSGGGSTVVQPAPLYTNQAIIPKIGLKSRSITTVYPSQVFTTANMTSLVKANVEGNQANNGYLLRLLEDVQYRTQSFYSSDHTEALKRPKFSVTFTLPDQKQSVKVKKKLDGGFITLEDDRKLRFIYQEEYSDLDGKLTYNIYNDKHEVVMTDVLNSLLLAPKRLDISNIKYGKNTIVLNVDCCLACGEYFILELINEKQEKWYLRFKTAPKGSNSYIQGHPCGI